MPNVFEQRNAYSRFKLDFPIFSREHLVPTAVVGYYGELRSSEADFVLNVIFGATDPFTIQQYEALPFCTTLPEFVVPVELLAIV